MEMKLGPVGDYTVGEKWEETGRDTISHIFVNFDHNHVTSIQFGYVQNGALVLSKKHGGGTYINEEDSTQIVRLNHETEFITGISGKRWESDLSSLTFYTNEGKHEAFRADFDKPSGKLPSTIEFHSGIHDRREFGGFFGSVNPFGLNSIGLYIRPVLSGIKQENV